VAWLVAEYQSTALFSLKPAWATSSGGKSLLVPTPYAVKMAILDAVCRTSGVAVAEKSWPQVRDLAVALRPPEHAVVTNLFTRILKPNRTPPPPGSQHAGPLGKTICYREYVYLDGPLGLALGEVSREERQLVDWLLQINYLGKRGGFVQLLAPPTFAETLPGDFIAISDSTDSFPADGVVQQLDDCDASLTFEKASVYSGKSIRTGRERVLHHAVLPYRLVRSSKGFSHYELIDG
jgi:hypothetical protein